MTKTFIPTHREKQMTTELFLKKLEFGENVSLSNIKVSECGEMVKVNVKLNK